MTWKLYIDDDLENRPTPDGFIRATNASEAVGMFLKNGCPYFISFDHDLGDGIDGIGIAHWLVNWDIDNNYSFIPKNFGFAVHSKNPVGAKNIFHLLFNYLEVGRA